MSPAGTAPRILDGCGDNASGTYGVGGESAVEQVWVLRLLVYAVDGRQLLRHLCIAGHMLHRSMVEVPNPVLVVCVVTRHTLAVYRCFGTACRMLPIPFTETSARKYQHTLLNSPEERLPQLHRGGRLKSCVFTLANTGSCRVL